MSEANVEIVRASIAAFRQGDLDEALQDFDRDVAVRPDPSWPENRPRLGRDAARSLLADIMAAFGTVGAVSEESVDAGDRVLTRMHISTHGQLSGVGTEFDLSQVHTLRQGKVVMLEYFLDHQKALEAAGLAE